MTLLSGGKSVGVTLLLGGETTARCPIASFQGAKIALFGKENEKTFKKYPSIVLQFSKIRYLCTTFRQGKAFFSPAGRRITPGPDKETGPTNDTKASQETGTADSRKRQSSGARQQTGKRPARPTKLKFFRNAFGEFKIKSYICNEILGSFRLVV